MTTILRSPAAWLLALFPLIACGGEGGPGSAAGQGRGVLLIAVDALRFDRTSLGRSDVDTTPGLAALAAAGTCFDDTWSPVPRRFDAHVSLLTGCDPLIARRPTTPSGPLGATLALPEVVPHSAPSIAVEFLAGGFATAAYVDDPVLTKARGFDRGFQEFVASRGGEPLDERLVDWVDGQSSGQDWFAYLHVGELGRLAFEPADASLSADEPAGSGESVAPAGESFGFHALPRSFAKGGPRRVSDLVAQYDAALVALDRRLSQLTEAVSRGSRGERVTVVVVGTYGMPFGESGVHVQPLFPDAPDLRVPWIIRPAGERALPAARSIPAVASLMDVGPTLLELAELPLPGELHGISRLGEIQGDAPVPARSHVFARGAHGSRAVIDEVGHGFMISPRTMPRSVLESWLGAPHSDVVTFERWIERSGPTACDPLELHLAVERSGPLGWRELWTRWAEEADRARDLLHFGSPAGTEGDGGSASLTEVAARLRELQR